MTKIGVGVGEDFPIEDKHEGPQQGAGQAGGEAPGYDYDYHYGYRYGGCGQHWDKAEWRARKAEWRAQRHEWRRRHRDWRRRFRAEMRGRGYGGRPFFLYPFLPILAAAVVLSLLISGFIAFVAEAPFLILGLLLLAVLYAVHRHHQDGHAYDGYYEAPPAPPANPPHQEG